MKGHDTLSYEKLISKNNGCLLKVTSQSFDSSKEVDYLIRYVTRSRENEKQDLISYGGRGADVRNDVSIAIKQWKAVQAAYTSPKRKFGRYCFHEIYCLTSEVSERIDEERLDDLAYELSEEYWKEGHQVIYGIHKPDQHENRVHIHFAINTVCFRTGKKWHDWFGTRKTRNERFDTITESFIDKSNLAENSNML